MLILRVNFLVALFIPFVLLVATMFLCEIFTDLLTCFNLSRKQATDLVVLSNNALVGKKSKQEIHE